MSFLFSLRLLLNVAISFCVQVAAAVRLFFAVMPRPLHNIPFWNAENKI